MGKEVEVQGLVWEVGGWCNLTRQSKDCLCVVVNRLGTGQGVCEHGILESMGRRAHLGALRKATYMLHSCS